MTSEKAEVVGQIMTRRVQVVSATRSLASMVPMFASTGHHHIPVVDLELRLIGILTQTDVVRARVHRGRSRTARRSEAHTARRLSHAADGLEQVAVQSVAGVDSSAVTPKAAVECAQARCAHSAQRDRP